MGWIFLSGAIVFEVVGTLCLRMASTGTRNRRWLIGVALGYLVAFTLLVLVLETGMAIGVAYGIWSAVGVALTAILSRFFFKEPFTLIMSIGIALIVGGVLLIEIGAEH